MTRCLNKDKISKTWIKMVTKTKTKYRRHMDYRCYNAKYAQQCFSIPTNIQNMDKMNLQFEEEPKIAKTTSMV